MSSYSYSSLPASGEDIRLLRLLPNEDEAAPLHCELRDYSLRRSTSRAHLYEAVSYVWGDPDNTLSIFVDKRQFQVTVNLHAALLRLRDHSFERILWVDAICINQNNNDERRQQVQLMARIYNSLGEEIEEIKGALEDIQVASNKEPRKNSKEFQHIWVKNIFSAKVPNYEISWEEIFQRTVKFILGKDLSLNISSQRAMFQCKGFILGQVYTVKRDSKQHVSIKFRFEARDLGKTVQWDLQASAIPMEEHDIICLLYGASKPSIIRLREDHFAVVVIAATPLDRESHVEWPQLSQSKILSLRNILLVWDWESSCGKIQDGREYKSLTKKFSQVSVLSRVEAGGYLEKVIRLWNDIAILDDLGEYKEANERLIAAQDEYYLAAFGQMPSSYESESECGRTLLAFAAGKGHESIVKLLLDTIHPNVNDGRGRRTPLWLAVESGHEAVVNMLLATGQVDADSKNSLEQTPLFQAAENGHENIVKLLLATDQVDADSEDYYRRTPLSEAAKEGHESVVKLLIAMDQVEVNSKDGEGRTPLFWAAVGGHEAVVKLLLATGQELIPDTVPFGQIACVA
ncbi:hypothetical protein BTUL_0041g00010 [Botrytis tulipae]|uniref:Heterokaryon incompatibility domain-containing protein n=1 Tax=Botrytis tulipae TaxID=87230 RepID=A0A4Z1F2G2_9HELO|nr:hypothetical protein BTUL_0041g00010 [Botrytis tulipae]